jgi:hypothetical protein
MAKIYHNTATHGMNGQVNQFVYYDRYGKDIAAKPGVRKAPFSAEQKNLQSRFKRGVAYATMCAATDPALMLAYKSKAQAGQTGHNIAIADYCNSPVIISVDISDAKLVAGGRKNAFRISAMVTDDFRVATVKIRIEDQNGKLVEKGDAVIQADGLNWIYTTRAYRPGASSTTTKKRVTITATDVPGNSVFEERIIG